jgi:hypothetical protein
MSELSPFLGVKPTWAGRRGMSACDPMSEKLRFKGTPVVLFWSSVRAFAPPWLEQSFRKT